MSGTIASRCISGHWPPDTALLGFAVERGSRPWLARPLYVAAVVVFVAVLDLLALDGRTLQYLDLSLKRYQSPKDSVSIDTLCALAANGVVFYMIASLLERWGRGLMAVSAGLLFVIAPFSTLEPLGYLADTGGYSLKVNWVYLAAAVTTAVLSHHRQRKSFYYAGLVNVGFALYLIADGYHWKDQPWWAIVLVGSGLIVLVAGFVLDARERRNLRTPEPSEPQNPRTSEPQNPPLSHDRISGCLPRRPGMPPTGRISFVRW